MHTYRDTFASEQELLAYAITPDNCVASPEQPLVKLQVKDNRDASTWYLVGTCLYYLESHNIEYRELRMLEYFPLTLEQRLDREYMRNLVVKEIGTPSAELVGFEVINFN